MGKKSLIDDLMMYFNDKAYWVKRDFDPKFEDYFLNIIDRVKEEHYSKFDEKGIPLGNHGGKIGLQYNPVTITSYALGVYQLYLESNDENRLNEFIKMANWLVDNQIIKNEVGVWQYYFDWKNIKSPWISGMAQGEALSVLTRAYKKTKDNKYLKSAYYALNSFKIDIHNGGVVSYIDNDFKFYEEYVTSEPVHVLNGFLYALWGIYEYYDMTRDFNAKLIFDEGIESLIHLIPRFDSGFWSKYSLGNKKIINIASFMYHELHIVQLESINQIVTSTILETTIKRWKRYSRSAPNKFLALMMKSLYKIINK